jgi:hypothetical protein
MWMEDNLHLSDTMVIRLLFLKSALLGPSFRLSPTRCILDALDRAPAKYRALTSTPLKDEFDVFDLVMKFLMKRVHCPTNVKHVLHLGTFVGGIFPGIRYKIQADVMGVACEKSFRNYELTSMLRRAFVDPTINTWMGVNTVPGGDAGVTI